MHCWKGYIHFQRVADLETKLADISKIHIEKLEELETRVNGCELDAKKNNLDNKIKDLEENQNHLIEESMEKYQCKMCEFTSFYRKGLKIHKKKMHKSFSCDEVYDSQGNLLKDEELMVSDMVCLKQSLKNLIVLTV